MDNVKEKETIGMLLDIEHFYGEHEGRMGPVVLTLCLAGAPILFYVYFGLFSVIPIWLFLPIEIYFSVRVIMKIIGRESYRLNLFRKQLNDDYTSTANLLNTKVIHPDGCIEYSNGTIMYLVCCFNGTSESELVRSVQLRKLLDNMLGDYVYDTYIHNVNESPALRDYYNSVSNFDKNSAARNFIKIIDHNIELTEDTSVVQCTIYAIKGNKSDWKDIKTQIDSTLNSRIAKCYKKIYRVSNADDVNAIFNRNIDSVINIEDLQRRKYATQEYDTSKVLAYDLPDDKEIVQGVGRVKPIIPEAPKGSFHITFKEEENSNRV